MFINFVPVLIDIDNKFLIARESFLETLKIKTFYFVLIFPYIYYHKNDKIQQIFF